MFDKLGMVTMVHGRPFMFKSVRQRKLCDSCLAPPHPQAPLRGMCQVPILSNKVLKRAANMARVVIPQGCNDANPGLANCDNNRGSIFTSNASSTWSTQRLANDGLFSLETYEEGLLGLSGNAFYGFDVLILGLLGSQSPSLSNQLIAGIATNNFWYVC